MRRNLWLGGTTFVLAVTACVGFFAVDSAFADDQPPKDDVKAGAGATPTPDDLKAEMEQLYVKCKELRDSDVLSPYVDVERNLWGMLAISASPNTTLTNEDVLLIGDLVWIRRAMCRALDTQALCAIFDPEAAKDPAKAQKAKDQVAEFERAVNAYTDDYRRLLKKCYPLSDVVEPLRKEFRKACLWRDEDTWRDLRYMYFIADNTAVFTDDEKKLLDDLGVRFERGCAQEYKLMWLLVDEEAMANPKEVERARLLLNDFKSITANWGRDHCALRDKIVVSDREQRAQDAAKALEDKRNAALPK